MQQDHHRIIDARYRQIFDMRKGASVSDLRSRFFAIADQMDLNNVSAGAKDAVTYKLSLVTKAYFSAFEDARKAFDSVGKTPPNWDQAYGVFVKRPEDIMLYDIDMVSPMIENFSAEQQRRLYQKLENLLDYNSNWGPVLSYISCVQAVTDSSSKLFDRILEKWPGAFQDAEKKYLFDHMEGCHSTKAPNAQLAHTKIIEAHNSLAPHKKQSFWSKALSLDWF